MANQPQNPQVRLWSKEDGTFLIMLYHFRKGEMRWMGDGAFPSAWKHAMDFDARRDETPKLFSSKEEAQAAVEQEVIPYILRWQPGWDEFIRGWDLQKARLSP